MFCTHCGALIGGRFCVECGRPVAGAFEPDTPVQAMTDAPDQDLLAELNELLRGGTQLQTLDPVDPVAAEPAFAEDGSDTTNVTVNVAGPRILYEDDDGPSLLLRFLWYVFVGWWVGLIWIAVAAALDATIIGLPLGLMMLNNVPKVMTLKSRRKRMTMVANPDGSYSVHRRNLPQYPFWIRAVYFLVVGWWLSFFWVMAAYLIGLPIITLPISFWMFDRVPILTTLARY